MLCCSQQNRKRKNSIEKKKKKKGIKIISAHNFTEYRNSMIDKGRHKFNALPTNKSSAKEIEQNQTKAESFDIWFCIILFPKGRLGATFYLHPILTFP